MPEAVFRIKDPTKARAGRMGAETRWGPPGTRTVSLADLTLEQRRLVLALVDAAKSVDTEKAAPPTNGTAQEVSSASSNTTAQAA